MQGIPSWKTSRNQQLKIWMVVWTYLWEVFSQPWSKPCLLWLKTKVYMHSLKHSYIYHTEECVIELLAIVLSCWWIVPFNITQRKTVVTFDAGCVINVSSVGSLVPVSEQKKQTRNCSRPHNCLKHFCLSGNINQMEELKNTNHRVGKYLPHHTSDGQAHFSAIMFKMFVAKSPTTKEKTMNNRPICAKVRFNFSCFSHTHFCLFQNTFSHCYGVAKAALDHMTRMVALGKQITHNICVSSHFLFEFRDLMVAPFVSLRNGWERSESQQYPVSAKQYVWESDCYLTFWLISWQFQKIIKGIHAENSK